MSSLAASRADNFYYPPEWRPEMGGISKFQGSKGANQYEKYGIIRFELPFDAWCLKCNQHLSKGLRFNAKKDRVGKYFSTTIYSFTTKCYACEQQFVIRTDPKNSTYEFSEGLRKHEQEYTPELEDGAIEVLDDETKQMIKVDPMFKLQHDQEESIRLKSANERLSDLQSLQEGSKNDYDKNSMLRKRIRMLRKDDASRKEAGKQLGLSIPLLDASEQDVSESKKIKFKHTLHDTFAIQEKINFAKVQSQSIFSSSSSAVVAIVPPRGKGDTTPATIVTLKKKKAIPASSSTSKIGKTSSHSIISSQMIEKLVTHRIKVDHFATSTEGNPSTMKQNETIVTNNVAKDSTKLTAAAAQQDHSLSPMPSVEDDNALSALFGYGDDDDE